MTIAKGILFEGSYGNAPAYIKFNYSMYGNLLQDFLRERNIELPLIPNETTTKAIAEAKNWKKLKKYASAEALLADCI